MFSSSSQIWMWELGYKESWALNIWCFWTVVLENILEHPLDCKDIKPLNPKENQVLNIHWKEWFWSWSSNNLATWYEELTHWKRPQCWERLRAGGEGDDREWDTWMALSTWWTWVWVDSGSWWWTGRPGVLWFMGSQRVGHNWATELNWMRIIKSAPHNLYFVANLLSILIICTFHLLLQSFTASDWCNWPVSAISSAITGPLHGGSSEPTTCRTND